jgi:hypothetical protein
MRQLFRHYHASKEPLGLPISHHHYLEFLTLIQTSMQVIHPDCTFTGLTIMHLGVLHGLDSCKSDFFFSSN